MRNVDLLKYVVRSSAFSSNEKLVAHTLIFHRNAKSYQCNPSIETIMFESGLSESSVYRAIRSMKKAGFLFVMKGKGKSNWYGFAIPVTETKTPVTETPKPLKNSGDEELAEAADVCAMIDEARKTEGRWRRAASAAPASLDH